MAMPLALAQEIVAVEAGFPSWSSLKAGASVALRTARNDAGALVLKTAVPIVFVRDVTAGAALYMEKLGFTVDFLHGNTPFYGSVSRDCTCFHLRLIHRPNFDELAQRERSLILATVEVSDVKALFGEFQLRGAEIAQRLVKQAWGGTDFHVRDLDGNVIAFVEYQKRAGSESD